MNNTHEELQFAFDKGMGIKPVDIDEALTKALSEEMERQHRIRLMLDEQFDADEQYLMETLRIADKYGMSRKKAIAATIQSYVQLLIDVDVDSIDLETGDYRRIDGQEEES